MIRLLAFDTSGPHCAAALLLGDALHLRVDDMARGQAEHLMPMLEEMLAEAHMRWRDLDAIGVGVGPGNFTGIRISVSAARGLALSMNRKYEEAAVAFEKQLSLADTELVVKIELDNGSRVEFAGKVCWGKAPERPDWFDRAAGMGIKILRFIEGELFYQDYVQQLCPTHKKRNPVLR